MSTPSLEALSPVVVQLKPPTFSPLHTTPERFVELAHKPSANFLPASPLQHKPEGHPIEKMSAVKAFLACASSDFTT